MEGPTSDRMARSPLATRPGVRADADHQCRVPEMWKRRVKKSDEELRAFIAEENEPQFIRDAVEAERAVYDVLRVLRDLHHPGVGAQRVSGY